MKFQDGANRIRKDFIGYGYLSRLYLYSYLLFLGWTHMSCKKYQNILMKYGIRHARALHSLYIV